MTTQLTDMEPDQTVAQVVDLELPKIIRRQAEVMAETQQKLVNITRINTDTAKEQLPDILETQMVSCFRAVVAVTIMAPAVMAEVQRASMVQAVLRMLSALMQLPMALVAVLQKLIPLGNAPKVVLAIRGFWQ